MKDWLVSLSKLVSPSEAQKAHISLLEAQKRELESLVERQKVNIEELRAEHAKLHAENDALKLQVVQLKQEAEANNRNTHNEKLDEVREKILALISRRDGLVPVQIAEATGIGEQVALHHLEGLQQASFVRLNIRSKAWSVNSAGRDYLVDHGLIT